MQSSFDETAALPAQSFELHQRLGARTRELSWYPQIGIEEGLKS